MPSDQPEVIEVSREDIVDAMCQMVAPICHKTILPDRNKYGVDVLYSKSDPSKFMLHFVTTDMLEINFEFDMLELKARGKEYLESRQELLIDQLEKARQVRQEANSIVINDVPHETVETPEPEPTAIASAISETLH